MKTLILLISPDEGFGELMKQVLVEEGGYNVDLVPDSIKALAFAQEREYHLAILDCAANDVPFAELATTLRDWHPGIQLVLVPPNNDPDDQVIDHTNPDALLSKPFYLPELLEVIANLLSGRPAESAAPAKSSENFKKVSSNTENASLDETFPWLENVNRAAQYLASLSLETSARAALITKGEKLWAYAGELGQSAANHFAETIGRQWGSQSGNALARFVTLEESEFMLYATGLKEQMVLALIFDAKTPFSKVRTQSSRVAKALAAGLLDEIPGAIDSPEPDDLLEKELEPEPDAEVLASETPPEQETGVHKDEPFTRPLDWLPHKIPNEGALLEEVEQNLDPFAIPSDWKPEASPTSGPSSYLEDLLGEPIPSVSLPYETLSRPDQPASGIHHLEDKPYFPPPETMSETRPTRVSPSDSVPLYGSESASYFDITYACMLIPRLPQHHLVSDLAQQLEKWMFQICVSFDWRIGPLAIRPNYMQWMVKVHSATAPRFLMQIITRITSQRIFAHFSHLTAENPSGEFWAPGWLVITSESLPPPQMSQDFVEKTRRRQGLK